MNPVQRLRDRGQSIWLDNITRTLLDTGGLQQLIEQCGVTGLTSNPSIFDRALRESSAYDAAIRSKRGAGMQGEVLFVQLALEDLRRAADLLHPVFVASAGLDGWVSMEVSPLLAHDAAATLAAARQLHEQAARPNLLVKIPGNEAGLVAVEEAIFAGIPVNVTLLFSAGQYRAAAAAYLSGIERRIAAGLDPRVTSVASVFVSRWDQAGQQALAHQPVPALHNRLALATAQQTLGGYRDVLNSPRSQQVRAAGARVQRLLWASTGSKDPALSDVHYIEALIAEDTINTMPEPTLRAFADHGQARAAMAEDGRDAAAVLSAFAAAGIEVEPLAQQLQRDGVQAFVDAWNHLLARIEAVQ